MQAPIHQLLPRSLISPIIQTSLYRQRCTPPRHRLNNHHIKRFTTISTLRQRRHMGLHHLIPMGLHHRHSLVFHTSLCHTLVFRTFPCHILVLVDITVVLMVDIMVDITVAFITADTTADTTEGTMEDTMVGIMVDTGGIEAMATVAR